MSDFTKEQVDEMIASAVSEATSPLKERIGELEAAVQETEVGTAVANATAELEAKISELAETLDAKEVERAALAQELEETQTFWSESIAAQVEADELAAKRTERIAEAKDASPFDDEYLNEHADRFAAESDEAWSARLEEWKLIAEKAKAPKTESTGKPGASAMQGSRNDETGDTGSAIGLIGSMRRGRYAGQSS